MVLKGLPQVHSYTPALEVLAQLPYIPLVCEPARQGYITFTALDKKCQNIHLAFLSSPFPHLLYLRYLNTMLSADILALHLKRVCHMLKTMTFLKSHLWQGDGFLAACFLQVWYRHLSVKHCVKLEW